MTSPTLAIPLTRGGQTFLKRKLERAGFTRAEIRAAVRQWWRAHLEDAPHPLWLPVFRRRLEGLPGAPALETFYDVRVGGFGTHSAGGRAIFIERRRGQSLSHKTHADELASMNAQTMMTNGDGEPFITLDPRVDTLAARAMSGEENALGELGVAQVERQVFPVVYVDDEDTINSRTGMLTRREVRALPPPDPDFGVVAFFEELRVEGRLPLASTEMVRRFVMMLAAPLLREVLTGRLGVYWLYGPPGSGKEFLLVIAKALWTAVGEPGARASVELRDPSFAEDRKTIANSATAVYAHLAEAGKHGPSMISQFIRLTGSQALSVRGLYRDEISLPNSFVYLADSAEPVPNRREISRRTCIVELVHVDEGLMQSTVDEVVAQAPRIIGGLRHLIERKGRAALDVASPEGRPHGLVFLADVLDAKLDPVVGEELAAIFEAMVEYNTTTERKTLPKPPPSAKAPSLANDHPVLSAAHFIELMASRVGHRAVLEGIRHATALKARIERESLYTVAVAKYGFLPVEVYGKEYGFRFIAPRGGTFVFFRLEPDFSRLDDEEEPDARDLT